MLGSQNHKVGNPKKGYGMSRQVGVTGDTKIGGPRDHINIRILHPGSKAQYERGISRNHGSKEPCAYVYVYVVVLGS